MSRAIARRARRRVLLAWELGDGLGHVGRLLPLARRLAEEGFEPVFALRDPIAAGPRATSLGYRVLAAPAPSARRALARFFARSFADILALVGFEDETRLAALVHAWRGLVEIVEPDLVVGDFSPGLALAMSGSRAPLLLVGSGFSLPPAQLSRFPIVNPDGVALADPARLLRAIGRVLPRGVACRESDLPRLLGGDWQAACTWPQLDPYRAQRSPAAIGPMAPSPGARAARARSGWFAYLASDAPRAAPILDGLLSSGSRGAAFVRGADAALHARFAAAGHRLHAEPPPLAEALEDAAVVVHHGGINTTETALAMGVPQLVFSRHLEQHLTGAAIEAAGVGRCLRGAMTPQRVTQALDALIASEGAASAAQRCAHALTDRAGALDTVVAAALALMPIPVAGAA